MNVTRSQHGAILVIALVTLAVLSVLGGVALRVASDQVRQASQAEREEVALQLADAGIERILAWFAEPSRYSGPSGAVLAGPCTIPLDASDWFRKRCVGRNSVSSFTTTDHRAQFVGRSDSPDMSLTWDVPLNTWPAPPFGRGILANAVQIQLWGPSSADGIATVLSRGTVGSETAAMRAELIEGPWSGLVGAIYAGQAGPGPFPVRVHWGDVFVDGPIDLNPVWDYLPRHDPDAPLSASPYSAESGSDRWFDLNSAGPILAPVTPVDGHFEAPYGHLHPYTRGSRPGVWAYEALKGYAKQYGRYFTTRGTGLVYPDGKDPGLTPSLLFATESGNGRELLFIDTLDRQAPRSDNLERLHVTFYGSESDAYLGAHVVVSAGTGRSVTVDALPEKTPAPPGGLVLPPIHYKGVLLVAGEIETESRVNVFGAIAAGQGFRDQGGLEIWYDVQLSQGYRKSFAPVLVKPGSRRRVALQPRPDG